MSRSAPPQAPPTRPLDTDVTCLHGLRPCKLRATGQRRIMCERRKQMKVNEEVWKFMQHHLGYTDEELEIFRNNPKNVDIVSKAQGLMKKTIIAEVIML
jgi:hypothetical protein